MALSQTAAARIDDRPPKTCGPLPGLLSLRFTKLYTLLRSSRLPILRETFEITEVEWQIIVKLGECAPLSLNGLASELLQDRGQLSRAVKALVERGLLTRARKRGGPGIAIDLSDTGRALYARLWEMVIGRDRWLTQGLDPEQIADTMSVVEQLIERAQMLIEQPAEAMPPATASRAGQNL